MADLETKRIINLVAETAPAEGDVFVVDNESTGTKKLPISGLINYTISKSGLSDITTTEDISQSIDQSAITRIPDKKFNGYGGLVDSTNGHSVLWFEVPVDGIYTINSTSSSQFGGWVYSALPISSANAISEGTKPTNTQVVMEASAGQYIAVSAWSADFTIEASYAVGTKTTLKSTLPLTDAQDAQVRTYVTDALHGIESTGYNKITGEWALQDWKNFTETSYTRAYRVHYEDTLQFDRDVTLVCAVGFYIFLYLSDNTYISSDPAIDVPANTPFKLTVRRVYEDTAEIADIEEFASAVSVTTKIADMERLKYTFTDVSMFERVGVCGDSFAGGGGIISGVSPLTWGKNLERQAGITVDIYAKSGESIVGWNSDTTNGLPALLAGTECGLYWLAHGINGTSTAENLGTSADMSASPHPATFYGQYVEAIEQIKATYPKARIVIATITGTSYSLYQQIYRNANTAIREIADYCDIPLIDLVDDDFYKSPWYANHNLSNHPTAMLCAGMAQANRRLLTKCIMENSDYFINYGNKYE